MDLLARVPAKIAAVLFCLAALYFVARGPWRAVGSVNSYDFASVYGATRCWLHGENPYDMHLVNLEVHRAGDDPASFPNTDPPPSVYLPTAFPLLAPIAWMPWKAARLSWSLLSVATFVLSAALILRSCDVTENGKWLLGAGFLLFSPTSSGLSTGNPGVISCGLTLAAIYLVLQKRPALAAALLGAALSLKPQISIAAVAVLLLWGYWRTIALSFVVPILAALVSFLRVAQLDQYGFWLATLRHEIGAASLPGGINDPSPANYFSYHLINSASLLAVWLHDSRVINALIWICAAGVAGIYLWLRRKTGGDRRPRDIAFCCTLPLAVVYHRYYDAQLLLGVIPLLLTPAERSKETTQALWIGLAVLTFPLQAILAESLHNLSPASPAGFLLLRHQPVVVLLLCLLLLPWRDTTGIPERDPQGGHGTHSDATVCNSQG